MTAIKHVYNRMNQYVYCRIGKWIFAYSLRYKNAYQCSSYTPVKNSCKSANCVYCQYSTVITAKQIEQWAKTLPGAC